MTLGSSDNLRYQVQNPFTLTKMKRRTKFLSDTSISRRRSTKSFNLEEYGCKGIDNHSKFCNLNGEIKTSSLDNAKMTIPTSNEYYTKFDACITL